RDVRARVPVQAVQEGVARQAPVRVRRGRRVLLAHGRRALDRPVPVAVPGPLIARVTPLLKNSTTVVWFILIGATLTSWWLGTNHGVNNEDVAGVLILLVAFIKVRFVGLYFMELRDAPIPLRIIFETWCFVVSTTVIVMFL